MPKDLTTPVINAIEAQGMPISPSAMTPAMGGPPTPPELDQKFSAARAIGEGRSFRSARLRHTGRLADAAGYGEGEE